VQDKTRKPRPSPPGTSRRPSRRPADFPGLPGTVGDYQGLPSSVRATASSSMRARLATLPRDRRPVILVATVEPVTNRPFRGAGASPPCVRGGPCSWGLGTAIHSLGIDCGRIASIITAVMFGTARARPAESRGPRRARELAAPADWMLSFWLLRVKPAPLGTLRCAAAIGTEQRLVRHEGGGRSGQRSAHVPTRARRRQGGKRSDPSRRQRVK